MGSDRSGDRHATPRHVISAPDDLWREYGDACADEDTTRAADIRRYMHRKVRAWRRKKAQQRG